MPEPAQPNTPPTDPKPQDPPANPPEPKKDEEKPIGVEVREKSMRELVREAAKDTNQPEPKKEDPEPAKPEPKKEEPKGPTPEEIEAQRKKEQEELAKKAADEALAKQRADEEAKAKAEADKKAKEEEEKRRADAATPPWHKDPNRPKDKNGNPLPLSYDEIYEAAKAAGKSEAIAEWEAREAEKAQKAAEEQKTKEAEAEAAKQQAEAKQKALDDQVTSELNDLYATNKLPKIVDEKDPNDPGMLARKALFEAGIKVNTERMEKGLPPITSVKLIFYEHYKPPKQETPNRMNAPVAGNAPPPAPTNNDDEYNWARDHNKSPRQLLREMKLKAQRAMGKN